MRTSTSKRIELEETIGQLEGELRGLQAEFEDLKSKNKVLRERVDQLVKDLEFMREGS